MAVPVKLGLCTVVYQLAQRSLSPSPVDVSICCYWACEEPWKKRRGEGRSGLVAALFPSNCCWFASWYTPHRHTNKQVFPVIRGRSVGLSVGLECSSSCVFRTLDLHVRVALEAQGMLSRESSDNRAFLSV